MEQKNSKTVTLYDVARLAGVSYQTVSRVVNNQPRVSPVTRERVLDVIERLNYRPSYAAQRLAANRSRTLAIITFGVGNYGPSDMLLNMETAAHEAGYELISTYVDTRNGEGIRVAIDRLLRSAVDGAILIAPVQTPLYAMLLEKIQTIPVIHVDTADQKDIASVQVDQYAGGILATQHLLDLGHREICEIRGPLNWFGASSRHAGFVDTLAEAGLEPAGIAIGDWSPKSGYQAAIELIEQYQFTAIVVGNDHMALGVLSALADRGLRVPEDVSLVGFDDVAEAPYYIPALTSVKQDFVQLGMTALHSLLRLINDPEVPLTPIALQPTLVVRRSAAPPRP